MEEITNLPLSFIYYKQKCWDIRFHTWGKLLGYLTYQSRPDCHVLPGPFSPLIIGLSCLVYPSTYTDFSSPGAWTDLVWIIQPFCFHAFFVPLGLLVSSSLLPSFLSPPFILTWLSVTVTLDSPMSLPLVMLFHISIINLHLHH